MSNEENNNKNESQSAYASAEHMSLSSTTVEEQPQGLISDLATDNDTIGFEPYVEELLKAISNENMKSPYNISIEGEWGYGKSSFMLQLRKELDKKGEYTFSFNAWRHAKNEELCASLAFEFMQYFSKKFMWKFKTPSYKLFYYRKIKDKPIAHLACFFISILLIPLTVFSFKNIDFLKMVKYLIQNNPFPLLIAFSVSFSACITLLIKLDNFLSMPLINKVTKYFNPIDYKKRIPFIEEFHRDFHNIIKSYIGSKTLYVFIDDIDRCETPRAADVIEALNLMIADGNKVSEPNINENLNLVFIIVMDREKVAASIAVKHESMQKYLNRKNTLAENNSSKENDCTFNNLEYGYKFIEKFIQLPFYIPRPRKEDLKEFLKHNPDRKPITIDYNINSEVEKIIAYVKNNQCNEAIDDLTNAINIDPKFEVAYTTRGNAYTGLNDYKKAIDDYSTAISINDREPLSFHNRGIALSKLGQHEKAIENFSKAIELDIKAPENYISRGLTYEKLELFDEAIKDFNKATELAPLDSRPYNNLGVIYDRLDEYIRAIENYTKAIASNPEFAGTYSNRGIVFDKIGEKEKALEDYNKAIKLNPNDAVYYNNRANTYKDLYEYEKALSDYREFIAKAPEHMKHAVKEVEKTIQSLEDEIKNNQGRIKAAKLNRVAEKLFEEGKYDEALKHFETVKYIADKNNYESTKATALGNIGTIYFTQGKSAEAKEYIEQALTIHKKYNNKLGEADTLGNLATVAFYSGKIEEAYAKCKEALSIHHEINNLQGEAQNLNRIGLIHSSKKEFEKALQYHEMSLNIQKKLGNDIEAAKQLGMIGTIYMELNETDKASHAFENALSVFKKLGNKPAEAVALDNLGVMYRKMGKYEEALEIHKKALKISKEIGDAYTEAANLTNIGGALIDMERFVDALDWTIQAYKMCKELPYPHIKDPVERNLKIIRATLGEQEFSRNLAVYEKKYGVLK